MIDPNAPEPEDNKQPCAFFVSGMLVMSTPPSSDVMGMQVRLSEKLDKEKAAQLGAQLLKFARDSESEITAIVHNANRRINDGECDTDDLISWFQQLAKICGWDEPEKI